VFEWADESTLRQPKLPGSGPTRLRSLAPERMGRGCGLVAWIRETEIPEP